MLKARGRGKGIEVVLKAETAAIAGQATRRRSCSLTDGRTIAADMVVVAIGIRPNVELARERRHRRQIAASSSTTSCETNIPGIYAIGECAEHRGLCYGLVEPAYEQARVLAQHLAGGRRAMPAACSPPI